MCLMEHKEPFLMGEMLAVVKTELVPTQIKTRSSFHPVFLL